MINKIRLMRVWSKHEGRLIWVPRVLVEMDFKTNEVSKAAPRIQIAIYCATRFNLAESKRLYVERRG